MIVDKKTFLSVAQLFYLNKDRDCHTMQEMLEQIYHRSQAVDVQLRKGDSVGTEVSIH